jgi:hypothetical protein
LPFESLDSQPVDVLGVSAASKVSSELDGAFSLQEAVVTESAKDADIPSAKLEKAMIYKRGLQTRNEGVYSIHKFNNCKMTA